MTTDRLSEMVERALAELRRIIPWARDHGLVVPVNPATERPVLYDLDERAIRSTDEWPLVAAVLLALGDDADLSSRQAVVDFFATAKSATSFAHVAQALVDAGRGEEVGPNSRGEALASLATRLGEERAAHRRPPLDYWCLHPKARQVALAVDEDLVDELTVSARSGFFAQQSFWDLVRRSDWVRDRLPVVVAAALARANPEARVALLGALQFTDALPSLAPTLEALAQGPLSAAERAIIERIDRRVQR